MSESANYDRSGSHHRGYIGAVMVPMLRESGYTVTGWYC
jgi:hypothetical protein